jgi:hypothetical protein
LNSDFGGKPPAKNPKFFDSFLFLFNKVDVLDNSRVGTENCACVRYLSNNGKRGLYNKRVDPTSVTKHEQKLEEEEIKGERRHSRAGSQEALNFCTSLSLHYLTSRTKLSTSI